mgnify:CR=1 FL=1
MRAITILAGLLAGLLYLEGSIKATTGDAELEHRPMLSPEEQATARAHRKAVAARTSACEAA